MATVERHAPGDFCWVELATTDAEGAKRFYGSVFGWDRDEIPMPAGAYAMWKLGGREFGAMYQLTGDMQKQSIPPHWLTYVAVTSVDAAITKAAQLGGRTMLGPHDVPGAGRMAVLLDPIGAVFAVWEAKGHIGARVVDEVGVRTWSELATRDAAAAAVFYTGLFGWGTKVADIGTMQYTEWLNAGRAVGGMFAMTGCGEEIPPHWMPYFRVSNCDETAARVQEAMGSVKVAPTDIPNVGRFAVLADPQGAVFAAIQMAA